MNPTLILVFVAMVQVTAYQSVQSQTDDSPRVTSTGEYVGKHGMAVSRDLLDSGVVRYGDFMWIEDVGIRYVNDCLNDTKCIKRNADGHCLERAKITKQIDLWVPNLSEEDYVWKKFKNRKVKMWRIRITKSRT